MIKPVKLVLEPLSAETHLGPASEETKEKTIQALKKFDIEKIGVSHCTGLETSMRLFQEFGDRFFFCNVGTEVEI